MNDIGEGVENGKLTNHVKIDKIGEVVKMLQKSCNEAALELNKLKSDSVCRFSFTAEAKDAQCEKDDGQRRQPVAKESLQGGDGLSLIHI